MVAYAIDALAFCRSMLGHPYLAGGCRCEVACYSQDCSGLIVAASRVAGLRMPCINSAGFAVWGREAGTLISEFEAIHTPFALGIKGPNGGEGGNGPLGHIFPMVGDGAHTYEAMSTRRGITIGSATGRRATRWMKVPGLTYGPKSTPAPSVEEEYEDMLIRAPQRQQRNEDRPAAVRLDIAGKKVVPMNAAKLAQANLTIPVPAGASVIGWYETFNDDGSKKGFKVMGTKLPDGFPGYEWTWAI